MYVHEGRRYGASTVRAVKITDFHWNSAVLDTQQVASKPGPLTRPADSILCIWPSAVATGATYRAAHSAVYRYRAVVSCLLWASRMYR